MWQKLQIVIELFTTCLLKKSKGMFLYSAVSSSLDRPNPGSLACESGILPLSYRTPLTLADDDRLKL